MPDGPPEIARYAASHMPEESERILEWVRESISGLTGDDCSSSEREQLLPGCNSLLDLAEHQASLDRQAAKSLRAMLIENSALLLEPEQFVGPTRRPRDYVEKRHAARRSEVAATLRAYLLETVDIARSFGIEPHELHDLLNDVSPQPDGSSDPDVISLHARRRRPLGRGLRRVAHRAKRVLPRRHQGRDSGPFPRLQERHR